MKAMGESMNPADYPVVRTEPALTSEQRAREIKKLMLLDFTEEAANDYLDSRFPPRRIVRVGNSEITLYGGRDGEFCTIPE